MALEIERKFLVCGDYKPAASKAMRITQGYLNRDPGRTVRVRMRGDQGYLTVKGAGNDTGTSRFEWEIEIPAADARELLALCHPGVIDKTRYLVPVGTHTFEVDEFHGENEGLVLAELELTDEHETFERPGWLGAEVTGDARYYNAQLAAMPFKDWR